jgi:uncharacterized protein with HEPN domain
MNREKQYLLDMLNSAKLAMSYVADRTEELFYQDVMYQDALIRRIEIIGEAARRISSVTQAEMQEIPWQEIIGMRNILIHEYDDVSLRVVWQTVNNQLPSLILILEKAIAERTE